MILQDLPPAPWKNGGPDNFSYGWAHCLVDANGELLAQADCDFPEGQSHVAGHPGCERAQAVIEFAVLARNAWEVMERRGWLPYRYADGWSVVDRFHDHPKGLHGWDHDSADRGNPFSSLVEADRWLTVQETSHV